MLSELIGAAAPSITPLAAQAANNTNGTRPTAGVHGGPISMEQIGNKLSGGRGR